MAKAFGRRPSEWLGPRTDNYTAYQFDRVVWYAGISWEAEEAEKDREDRPGIKTAKKLTQADIKKIRRRQKMSIEQRKARGEFDGLNALIPHKVMKVPESGVW